jgi:hypothetical protein
MIAETLAGIALVKSAVDGIKSTINTAKDISSIASDIDALLQGQSQVQAESNKKAGVRLADQFGVQSVAKEMIDAKLAAEQVAEVRRLVDHRFGSGTWQAILDERAKRIREAKEAAAAARREAIKKHNEMMETVKIVLAVGVVSAIALGFFIFVITASAMAYSLIT